MLGKIHFVFGILVILLFLGSGQYMDHYYGHLRDMELMNRALFRAGHLYILLFGLIHVALGSRFSMANRTLFRAVQNAWIVDHARLHRVGHRFLLHGVTY